MEKEKLEIKWSKRENDFMIYYPRKCDGALIQHVLLGDRMMFDFDKWAESMRGGKREIPYRMESLIKELGERGYDLSTLKFSIKLKPGSTPLQGE